MGRINSRYDLSDLRFTKFRESNLRQPNNLTPKETTSYPPPKNTPNRRIDNSQLKARW